MTLSDLLAELRERNVRLAVHGTGLKVKAHPDALTVELRRALSAQKAALVALLRATGPFQALPGGRCAGVSFELRNTPVGDAWLVANKTVLEEHPAILSTGLPVFFRDEIHLLRRMLPEDLREITMVKRMFPTSRVLQ